MRTTVELDDDLVKRARDVLASPSLRAMIEESLREAIRARQRESLVASFGSWDLAMTWDEMKTLRMDHPKA